MANAGDLRRLNELDGLTVAEGDPDPRGWGVTDREGREIGRVSDLLVDTDAMKARYLDVEVDRQVSASSGQVSARTGDERRVEERHVLVPVDAVAIGRREREEKRISVPVSAGSALLGAAPSEGSVAGRQETREWPRADRDACTVRFTRGGHHG